MNTFNELLMENRYRGVLDNGHSHIPVRINAVEETVSCDGHTVSFECEYNDPLNAAIKRYMTYDIEQTKRLLNSIYGSTAVSHMGIKKVIFNDPATIVIWRDGTKTVVKAVNEKFDPEKGLAMAISKKVLGNNHDYYNVFLKYLKKYKEKQE